MADAVVKLVQSRAVVTIGGGDLVALKAAQAAEPFARRAEIALAEIEDIASGAPEAPSILTKANRNGSNVEADAFRGAIGAAPITARASLIAPLTTAGIKAMGQSLDDDRLRSGYIPTFNGDVTLTETIVIREPGVRIFGDGGATYNRGAGKKGWLLGATGIGRMFDLGASRPSGAGENPADQWEIDHISLKQAPGAPIRSVDGIGFTARNNGPDRGAHIRSCSFIGLQDAITIENLDVSVTLASLNIESCVFQACDSAVNAKGRVFGLRFVGNQCEQNIGTDGIIRGAFDGGVTIDDNMLEGQPNPISIDRFALTGNSTVLRSAFNYFERNSGQWIYRFRQATPRCHYTVGPNYIHNITAADYVLFQDAAGSAFVSMFDERPVTFDNAPMTVNYGSNIFRNRINYYKVRKVAAAAKPTEVIIADYMGLVDTDNAYTHVIPASGEVKATPFGDRLCTVGTSFITVPMAVAEGDMVSLSILMTADEVVAGNYAVQIYNSDVTVKVKEWGSSGIATELNGKWALVSVAFVANIAATSLRLRIFPSSGTYTNAIAGIAAQNLGAHVNDGSVAAEIYPVRPSFPSTTIPVSRAYGGITLPAQTNAAVIVTVPPSPLDSMVSHSYSQDLAGLIHSSEMRTTTTVRIQLFNPTAGPITIPAGTFYVEVRPKAV